MQTLKHGISNLLLLCCVAVMVLSLWKLWEYYKLYHDGETEYEKLSQYVDKDTKEGTQRGSKQQKDFANDCPVIVDFASLEKINPDIVGWIFIPDTDISYPIVQCGDNEYYLHHTFQKKENRTGAIFLDSVCQEDFGSDNSILYGHNLKTGKMFGQLKRLYDTKYNQNADYKKHEKLWIITPEKTCEYQVFAAREINVNTDKDVYTVAFLNQKAYRDYLSEQVAKSMYDTGADVNAESMLTLSTCTSDTETGRFIVQAVKTRNWKTERKSDVE